MLTATTSLRAATLLLLLGCSGVCSVCSNRTQFSARLDLLLAEYDRDEQPPAQPPAPVTVSAALDLRHAVIYERSASVRILADFYLEWEDKRLVWNASDWGCDSAVLSAERLWLPDVVLLSVATAGGGDSDAGLRARVTSDGHVSWLQNLDLTTPITMSLYSWPKDEHSVDFKFGSRSHPADELDIKLNIIKHALVFEAGVWEVTSVRPFTGRWERLGAPQPYVSWTVTVRRRAEAHSLAVGAVLFAAVLLLLAAALLPPASRSALCATASFTATLWLISALARLPGGAEAPRALSLMCALSSAGAAAAVAAAAVLRVARFSQPLPHSVRSLVAAVSTVYKLEPPENSGGETSAWAAAARLLDLALLAVLLLTLLVIVALQL